MSKEIYKEYLCEWVDKKNVKERVELNQEYILGAEQFLSILHSRGLEAGTVLVLHEQHHNQIKRKPKTTKNCGNIMSKEIYEEYVVKFWIECKSKEERIQLNNSYQYKWSNSEIISGAGLLLRRNLQVFNFIELAGENMSYIQRKPKTQTINGHEVVAPRYDMPEHREDIIVMNCFNKRGIEVINFSAKTMRDVTSWGWFSTDNTEDAIAYANAHRENKND